VHVTLGRGQVSVTRQLLNRPCSRASHRHPGVPTSLHGVLLDVRVPADGAQGAHGHLPEASEIHGQTVGHAQFQPGIAAFGDYA
jgi:hypothetical protein